MSSEKYEMLLRPFVLRNGLVLKNRLLFPNAMHVLLQGPEKYPSEALIHEVTEICRSGASLLSFRHAATPFGGGSVGDRKNPNKAHWVRMDYTDPSVHNYICQVAEQAHMFGSKILIRLWPDFPPGFSYGGGKTSYVSFGNEIFPKERFSELYEQIIRLLKQYKEWGFDGLNFRMDSLIQSDSNLRTDEYGGEVENRGRFEYELFGEIKRELGKDFIIEGILHSSQPHGYENTLKHGYTEEEAIRFIKMIEDRIDILQVREAGIVLAHPIGYTHEEHCYRTLDFCRKLKECGIQVPLAANGGFQDPEDMEKALKEGVCELFSCGRAFIAEPEYVRKLHSCGREKATPCIQCNKCHGPMAGPRLAYCSVNPEAGIGHRIPAIVKPSLQSKKVAVIGGGPVGMRAACYAAERGHRVTLFEKSGYLGGKLKHADVYSFKWPIRNYRLWLIAEMDRRGVEVRLNCEPEPEKLRAEGFEAVIAATGSVAKVPDIAGAKKEDGTTAEGIWTCEDVYEGRAVLGENIVMIGGSETSMETAMHLCKTGHNCIVLTRQDKLCHDCHSNHYVWYSYIYTDPELGYGHLAPEWERYDNLTGITEATVIAVTKNSVTYIKDGVESTIECDNIVINGGQEKQKENALRYASAVSEFYLAGDVEDTCSDLQKGNRSAFAKALLL